MFRRLGRFTADSAATSSSSSSFCSSSLYSSFNVDCMNRILRRTSSSSSSSSSKSSASLFEDIYKSQSSKSDNYLVGNSIIPRPYGVHHHHHYLKSYLNLYRRGYATKANKTWTKRKPKSNFLKPPFSETSTYKIPTIKEADVVAQEPFYANVIVERLPVVNSLPENWESEYEVWSRAYNARFQKVLPEELIAAKAPVESNEGEEGGVSTLEKYQPASVETQEEDNVKTTNRKLREFLFLVVKEKGKETWGFPRARREVEWTMRTTAESAVEKALKNAKIYRGYGKQKFSASNDGDLEENKELDDDGSSEGSSSNNGLEYQMVGNCPMAHYTLVEGTNFYHRATYLDGKVILSSVLDDFAWVTKEELKAYILDANENALIQRIV
jgi:large subunit ribosomal protein L46